VARALNLVYRVSRSKSVKWSHYARRVVRLPGGTIRPSRVENLKSLTGGVDLTVGSGLGFTYALGVPFSPCSELVASSKCELATFSCVSGPVQSSRPVVEVALRVPFCVSERQSGWIESGVAVALISVALMESD
jgi:hypothetical protein